MNEPKKRSVKKLVKQFKKKVLNKAPICLTYSAPKGMGKKK